MQASSLRPLAERLFAELRTLGFDGIGVTRDSYGAANRPRSIACVPSPRARASPWKPIAPPTWSSACPTRRPMRPRSGPARTSTRCPRAATSTASRASSPGCCAWSSAGAPAARAGCRSQVLAFRGEESAWFGKAYMGSGALFGKLGPQELELHAALHRRDAGRLHAPGGADVEAIRAGQLLVDPRACGPIWSCTSSRAR